MHINSNTDVTIFQYASDYNKNYKSIKDQINTDFKNTTMLEETRTHAKKLGHGDCNGLDEKFTSLICEIQAENCYLRKKVEDLESSLEFTEIPQINYDHLEYKVRDLKCETQKAERDIVVEEKCQHETENKLNSLRSDKLIINTRLHKMKKNALTLQHRESHAEDLKYTTQLSNCQIG